MLPKNGNEYLKTIAVSRPLKPIYHSKPLDVNFSFLVSNACYDILCLLSGFSKGGEPPLSDSLKSETRCRDVISQHMRYRWNPLDEIRSKMQYLMVTGVPFAPCERPLEDQKLKEQKQPEQSKRTTKSIKYCVFEHISSRGFQRYLIC